MAGATDLSISSDVKWEAHPVGEDLTNDKYKIITLNSSDQAVVQTTSGGHCTGVLLNEPNPTSGTPSTQHTASVAISGVVTVIAGAAVTRQTLVMSDTAGKAITATAGKFILGMALESSTAGDQAIKVRLMPGAAKYAET